MILFRRINLLLVLLLATTSANAQIGIDNSQGIKIYYQYTDDTETKLEVCGVPDGADSYKGDIVIDPTAQTTKGELPVVSIGKEAFKNSTELTSISIPANIKKVGINAFAGCSMLEKAIFASVKDLCEIEFGNKEANPLYLSKHLFIGEDEQTVLEVPAGVIDIKNFAFAGGKYIKKIKLGTSVRKIGYDVFHSCEGHVVEYVDFPQMLEIEYGDGVSNPMSYASKVYVANSTLPDIISIDKNVKANAFKGADIKGVVFSNEVTSIGPNAFSGSELTSVTLPKTLVSIGHDAFHLCTKLTEVTIQSNPKDFGENVFSKCRELKKATITAELVTLPEGLFRECKNLKEVVLPRQTQTIGKNTFLGCTSLTSLPLPQAGGVGLKTIGEYAFSGCDGFLTLEIPETVEIISKYAFQNCANLTNLVVKERDTKLSILDRAFSTSSSSSLKYIFSYSSTAPEAESLSFEGNTNIQLFYSGDGSSYLNNLPWSSFNPTPFKKRTITYLVDGKDIRSEDPIPPVQVGEKTPSVEDPERTGWDFSGWQEDIPELMPDEDLEIHGYFTKEITAPDKVKYLLQSDTKEARVIGNDSPENVKIGPSIDFENAAYTVVAINDRAFKAATTLKSVDLSEASNVMSIGKAIFAECSNLENVKFSDELPNDLNEITDNMFYGCSALSSITIPTNVATIGESAFRRSGIKNLTLPVNITTLGDNVFMTCTNLENVEFAEGIMLATLPQNAFDGCIKLESFTLPSSTTTIGKGTFAGCSNLKQVYLNNVETISTYAFRFCRNLETITIKNSDPDSNPPTLGEDPFTDIYDKAALYVTDVVKYKDDTAWNLFKKIYPIDPVEIPSEELVITLEHETYTYDAGSEIKPKETVKWKKDEQEIPIDADEYIVSYENNIIVGTEETKPTVIITDKDGGNYKIVGSKSVNFKITPKAGNLEELLATKPQPAGDNITYNAKPQSLIKAGTIKKGISGSIKYSLDKKEFGTAIPQGKDAKKYTVYYMVVGDPNYTASDTLSLEVTIAPKVVTNPNIILSESSYAFTGSPIEIESEKLTVKDGSTEIPVNEYEVSYTNNVNAGTEASIIIKDKEGGNYNVSGSKTFTINKADIVLDDNLFDTPPTGIKDLVFNGTAEAFIGTPQPLINAGSLKTPAPGILEYSLDGKTFAAEIPTGTDVKTYKVYYRVTGDDNHNNSSTSSAMEVKISPKELTKEELGITLSPSSYTYDGNEKKPDVTVKFGNTEFVKEKDFTVRYNNNKNVGTAEVTIADKDGGNYIVSGSTTFTIKPAASSLSQVPTGKTNLTYNGTAQELLNKDGKTATGTLEYSLSEDLTTFKASIPTGTDAKTYTVYYRVKGNTNYSDSEISSVNVTIAPKEITAFALSQTSYTYDGSEKKPDVTVEFNKQAISKDEYTVSYSDNKNAGTATVTITDNEGGNFKVSGSKTFTVNKAALTISVGNYETFEGEAIPEFTVKYDGFVNNETEAVLSKKPIVRCSAIVGSTPGDYTISVSGTEAANYNITHKNGKLTILAMKFVAGGETSKDEDDPATYQITSTGSNEGSTPTVAITDDKDVGGSFAIPESVTYRDKNFAVTEIAASAFENNKNLSNVIIPSSITHIGDKAFKGCSNLESITVYATTPINLSVAEARGATRSDDGSSIFEGVNKATCVLYVPDASVELYKAAPVWKEFQHIVSMSTTGISGVTLTDDECFDIYNLQGLKVKSKATSLKGLPRGIYIINGKKYAVK